MKRISMCHIAKEIVHIAEELVNENGVPDLYVLREDGTAIPIYLSRYANDVVTAQKRNKNKSTSRRNISLPKPIGKEIYLTPQSYEFYSEMDENNKKDLRTYCTELQNRGTLEGNPHAEKVESCNGVFAIRLTQGLTNDRFFYVYRDGNDVVVFDAYTKAKKRIPTHILNKARKDMKRLKELSSLEGFKPFKEILLESQDNNS